MFGFFAFIFSIIIYSCVRFGICCVYAEKEEKVNPRWSIIDNIILFLVSIITSTFIFK